MLKLIYTETSLHLELLNSDLDLWLEQRSRLYTSIGHTIFASAETASFLLPSVVCEPIAMSLYLHCQGVQGVTVERVDLDRVEIGLTGYWLSTNFDSIEGIFVTQLPDRIESYLSELWCSANSQSVTSDRAIG
jgi:hypothetical protein